MILSLLQGFGEVIQALISIKKSDKKKLSQPDKVQVDGTHRTAEQNLKPPMRVLHGLTKRNSKINTNPLNTKMVPLLPKTYKKSAENFEFWHMRSTGNSLSRTSTTRQSQVTGTTSLMIYSQKKKYLIRIRHFQRGPKRSLDSNKRLILRTPVELEESTTFA